MSHCLTSPFTMLFLCLSASEKQSFIIQAGTWKIRLQFNSHSLSLHLKTISWFCSFINLPRYLFKYSWKPDPYSPCLSPYKFKEFQSHSHLPNTQSRVKHQFLAIAGAKCFPIDSWHVGGSLLNVHLTGLHKWNITGERSSQDIFKNNKFSDFPPSWCRGKRKARVCFFSLHSLITVPDLLGGSGQVKSLSMTFTVLAFSSWDCQKGTQMSGSSRDEPRAGSESCTVNTWILPWLRATHYDQAWCHPLSALS